MWNARVLLVALAGAPLASCQQNGSTSPEPSAGDRGRNDGLAGYYVLRTLAGDPLPAVGNQAANLVVMGDTIRLRADGTGLETGVELVLDGTLPEGEIKRGYERQFNYRLSGSRIEVEFPCPRDALMLCAALPHYTGSLTADGLELDYALYYRTPLVFERVAD
jgi:hypothetical protein